MARPTRVATATSPSPLPRPAVSAAGPVVGLKNVQAAATPGWMISLVNDKQTWVFNTNRGRRGSCSLSTSSDGGSTFRTGDELAPPDYVVDNVVETLDGEVLACVARSSDQSVQAPAHGLTDDGFVLKSQGWNPATGRARTWDRVLQAPVGVWFDGRWGLTQWSVAPAWSKRPGLVVVSEYGRKTNQGDPAQSATRAWLSLDHGSTWKVIFNLLDYAEQPAIQSLHLHGCAYDSYDDALWLASGDGGLLRDGELDGGFSAVWYGRLINGSDCDWSVFGDSISRQGTTQVVCLAATKHGVLILSDATPAAFQWVEREGEGTFSAITPFLKVSPNLAYGSSIWRNDDETAPVLCTFQASPFGDPVSVYCGSMLPDGETISVRDIYAFDLRLRPGARGVWRAVGPDTKGRVFVNAQVGLISETYRGTIAL